MLGTTLGEVFLRRCGITDVPCRERSFGPLHPGDDPKHDFLGEGDDIPEGGVDEGAVAGVTASDYLKRLTALAREEWRL